MEYQPISGLRREDFQKIVDGKQVDLFFLRNANGCEVAVTNYGGSLVAIIVPDREGKMLSLPRRREGLRPDEMPVFREPF